uniref:Lactate/malate dehydrogenase C-terminal domain-containing protein n=1 Tax=Anabas testudineus TaxID=64144 RepID=A0A3Q1HCU8_ANATE
MAKFVLAGRTDCPFYAKAELLADALQRSLPNFKTRKISILPDEWKDWLEATCQRQGWKHDKSPLVWRELVDEGGSCMLLGGFSDFLEHSQDYYGITSDMPTDMMLSVAAENLEIKMNLIKEEQHRASLIKALHIWISGALSSACHLLIPNLLTAEVFPHTTAISLHLLDVEGDEEELQGLRMETEDLALPLLHQVTIHTDLEQAFQEADVILLLDEWCSGGNDTEEEKKKKVKEMSERYIEYGQLIDMRAKKEVKVIVTGSSFVSLRCSLLVKKAHVIDSNQFVAMATQLENEARAILSNKLKVRASDIKDVIVWGNISGSFYIDLQRAKVFNYNGAIKGPSFFCQSVLNIFHDRFVTTKMISVTDLQHGPAISTANGILTVLKAWNGNCSPDDIFSLGVVCPGYCDLPDGIILSVPVTFTQGKWSVLFDVTVGNELKERLHLSASKVQQVCQVTKTSGDVATICCAHLDVLFSQKRFQRY